MLSHMWELLTKIFLYPKRFLFNLLLILIWKFPTDIWLMSYPHKMVFNRNEINFIWKKIQ